MIPPSSKYIAALVLFFISACAVGDLDQVDSRWNVLFISIDDLRPELGCYGKTMVQSPHIDKLAEEGVVFKRAYSPQALCNPARSALLTGLRPQTLGVFDGKKHFRETHPDITTLPQLFKNNGYRTFSFGKVFHHRDSLSWDTMSWVPQPEVSYPIYTKQENLDHQKKHINDGKINPKSEDWWAVGGHWVPAYSWEAAKVPDTTLFDGQIASEAIKKMQEVKDDLFFLAVGFFRPHIPYIAPEKYFDLYPLENLGLTLFPKMPTGAPDVALTNWGETRIYKDIPKAGPITEEKAREMIRGYYASISYVDAQVGRLEEALNSLELYEKTIIVLWGDHGYHLGDLGLWGKYTNFEQATRVPLIIKIPGQRPKIVRDVVELIDVFPTLADLGQLPMPKGNGRKKPGSFHKG